MNGRLTGQYIPSNSLLHRLDARAKFFGFLVLIAAVILTDSVWGYCLTGGFILGAAAFSHLPRTLVTGTARRLLPFFLIVFLMNTLLYQGETPLWQGWIVSISWEGIIQGANILLRVLLILVLSSILTMTTPPMELMSAIEALLSPLRLLRLPVEDVSMILSVAIQFIPTLMQESDAIRAAQTARGAQFESGSLLERARALPPVIVPIFLAAFKRADELASAMEARGYRGGKCRTKKERFPMNAAGYLALALCAALCVIQIIL